LTAFKNALSKFHLPYVSKEPCSINRLYNCSHRLPFSGILAASVGTCLPTFRYIRNRDVDKLPTLCNVPKVRMHQYTAPLNRNLTYTCISSSSSVSMHVHQLHNLKIRTPTDLLQTAVAGECGKHGEKRQLCVSLPAETTVG
jgi:hypothetical protein